MPGALAADLMHRRFFLEEPLLSHPLLSSPILSTPLLSGPMCSNSFQDVGCYRYFQAGFADVFDANDLVDRL